MLSEAINCIGHFFDVYSAGATPGGWGAGSECHVEVTVPVLDIMRTRKLWRENKYNTPSSKVGWTLRFIKSVTWKGKVIKFWSGNQYCNVSITYD